MALSGVYTTLEAVGRQLITSQPQGVTPAMVNDEWANYRNYVSDLIYQISDMVSMECERTFAPYYASVLYPYASPSTFLEFYPIGRFFNNSVANMFLNDDLYELDTLITTNGGANTTVQATDIMLLAETHRNTPYYRLQINNQTNYFTSPNSTSFQDGVTVTGWWGYVTDLPNTFRDVQTIAGTLSNTATSISVGAGNALSYETLGYIRIEDELILVTNIDLATNILTVQRGVNGTTAVSHTNYTIQRVYLDRTASLLITRLVAWYYQKRNDTGDRVQFMDGSSIVPSSIPQNLLGTLVSLKRIPYASWG